MTEVAVALGISKEIWATLPEDYRQKITKVVGEGNIALAKQILAQAVGLTKKVVGSSNPIDNSTEKKVFNPIEKAIGDAWDVGFFGDRHFNMQKLCDICRKRGLVGLWTPQKTLSTSLKLFADASRDIEENQVDALLSGFAATIGVDPNLVKRHFWAIKQGWEDQFLTGIAAQEEKRKRLESLAETAESEVLKPEEDKIEESEEE